MIAGNIKHSGRYGSLHPSFGKVFNLAEEYLLSPPADGRVELDGKNLFMIVSSGIGKGDSGSKLEVHRSYIDIHFVLEGLDTIGWNSLNSCTKPATEYSEKDEYQLFDDAPRAFHPLQKGDFAVYFPEDAHAPGCGELPFRKVVFKVRI